jgi:hypothetical protein
MVTLMQTHTHILICMRTIRITHTDYDIVVTSVSSQHVCSRVHGARVSNACPLKLKTLMCILSPPRAYSCLRAHTNAFARMLVPSRAYYYFPVRMNTLTYVLHRVRLIKCAYHHEYTGQPRRYDGHALPVCACMDGRST